MKNSTHTLAVLLMACGAAAGQTYTIQNLGTLQGPAQAQALNASGAVAGSVVDAASRFRGFVRGPGGTQYIDPVSGGRQTHTMGVNASGQAVTVSFDIGALEARAVLTDGASVVQMGKFSPRAINDAGLVVGSRDVVDAAGWHADHACTWQAGTITELPALGGEWSRAAGVNTQGWIVGAGYAVMGLRPRAVAWIGATVRDLGTLGGASAEATAIGDGRHVVGVSDTAAGRPHAFRYLLNDTGTVIARTDLGVLGGDNSYAYGVNSSGDVVGVSDSRAFLYHAGAMTDLNTLIDPSAGWVLRQANAINDAGQIAGWGTVLGMPCAFLLTPAGMCNPDVNADGNSDQDDVAYLINVVGGGANPTGIDPDFNHDGNADQDDIAALINAVAGGGCP